MGAVQTHAERTFPAQLPSPRGARLVVGRQTSARASALLPLGLIVALVFGSFGLWVRSTLDVMMPGVPSAIAVFGDPRVMAATVTIDGRAVPIVTTADDLRLNVSLWRRMHLANWNHVPVSLMTQGLDRMLERYDQLLLNPAAWDRMNASDWDEVPQPIQIVAYRRMLAYWAGYYRVGRRYGLPSALMVDTLSAIVMSESWFNHRAVGVNRDGTHDVGLGGASTFARQRMRALYREGTVDVDFHDKDYFDPWRATRFATLWFSLMLDEARGDLDVSVRAYNRGIGRALDELGSDYVSTVRRRYVTFIRNRDAPAAWSHLWTRTRLLPHRPSR